MEFHEKCIRVKPLLEAFGKLSKAQFIFFKHALNFLLRNFLTFY